MSRLAAIYVCVCVGVAGGGGALAQPRYARPPVAVEAQPPPGRPAQPPTAWTRPVVDVRAVLSSGPPRPPPRIEQEQILLELVAATPDRDAAEKADLLFRLAELYGARAMFVRATDPAQSKEAFLAAVKTWKLLVDNDHFRLYAKLDAALFAFGTMLEEAKYVKEARAVFQRLLKDYPQSVYVPQAYLVFAEYYLGTGETANAEAFYAKVLQFPESPVYRFALYRQGWIHYDLGRYPAALAAFVQVLQHPAASNGNAALAAAARAGLVESYLQAGKPRRALATFTRIDPAHAHELVQQLAARTAEAGKPEDAVELYRELLKTTPASPDVCRWQVAAVRALLSVPTASAAERAREVERLIELAVVLDQTKAADAAACRRRAVELSIELAQVLKQHPASLGLAERLRAQTAAAFPSEPASASDADLLWARAAAEPDPKRRYRRWATAADAYLVLADATTDPRGRHDAALLAVLAWKNGLDVDPRPAIQAGAIDLEAAARAQPSAIAVPAEEAKLEAAFALYQRSIVDRDELVRTKFLLATVHRRHGDHAKALALLIELADQFRDHESAELATNLALESLIRLGRFDELLALADRFAADAAFLAGKPALQANIKLLRSRSLRRARPCAATSC